jgi:hypothetical protein
LLASISNSLRAITDAEGAEGLLLVASARKGAPALYSFLQSVAKIWEDGGMAQFSSERLTERAGAPLSCPEMIPLLPCYPFDRVSISRVQSRHSEEKIAEETSKAPSVTQTLETLVALIRRLVTEVGGADVDAQTTFFQAGLDSAALVEFCAKLAREVGHSVAIPIVFDNPDPASLARYLLSTASPTTELSGDTPRPI